MNKAEFYANARTDLIGPLAGVVVVEATTTWAGPMAGCVLADFGASVIKVEHPDGEVMRRVPPFVPGTNLSVMHEVVNRNKRNLCLSLKGAEGRAVFLKLCATADIVIENFKPGTLDAWGVGYTDVSAVKPDIVYVSISGFGQFGPYCDRPGYDPIAQNFTGWSSLNGEPDGGPTKAPTFLGDDLGGLHAALGALGALYHRNRTGEGQHVDIALVDGLIFQSNGQLTIGALGLASQRWGNQFAIAAPVNVYVCTDGRVYTGVLLDSHWRTFCEHIGRPDLARITAPERVERRAELDALLAAWCVTRATGDVVETMTRLGLAVTRVNTFVEAAQDPHVRARDMLQNTALAGGAQAPLTGPAAKFSRTPTRVRSAAPALGEHSDSILTELGFSSTQIADLRAKHII
ncbi:MAG: CoA transferase [Gammaproteobacteria bacterium]|nr:CoA transferase [Gammaproteobacteria bacterium]